ncbi:MAG: hypothetical protein LC641_07395 [Spirochaeta sp.]|nr:hypothetical protein [Spirochaeta sp.]
MADPELYRGDQNGATAASLAARLHDIESELASSYERWDKLEKRRAAEASG